MLMQYFHYHHAQMNSSQFLHRELGLPQWWGSWLSCREILFYSSDKFLDTSRSSWWDMHYKMFRRVCIPHLKDISKSFFSYNRTCLIVRKWNHFLNHRNTIQIQMKTTSLSSSLCPLALLRGQKPCCSACRSSSGLEIFIFLFLSCGARAVSDTTLDLMAAAGAGSVAQGTIYV